MIELTPSARQRFDEYFQRLRYSLRGASPVEADDVEQSVREHIEVALAGAPAPVGGEQLAEVLDRLGSPDGWVPPSDRPVVQRVMERLRSGPEEWRLAYMTFGLFILALLLIPVGIGILLMFASFLASRAYLEFLESKGEEPNGRKWLVYPPIGFFLILAIAFFVVGPAGPVVRWGVGEGGFLHLLEDSRLTAPYHDAQFVTGVSAAVFGAWWILASLVGMVFLPVIRFVFKPLLARVRRAHFLGLTLVGFVVAGIGYALLRPWVLQLW